MIARLRSLLDALGRRKKMEAGMEEEFRFHMNAHAQRLMASGVPEAEARRRACMEFGSLDAAKEECRESRGLRWPEELARNARFAQRMLRRNPGFAVTAIGTLALGIGVNTAVFSVIDAVLLRPLPYPEPERLIRVVTEFQRKNGAIAVLNSAQDAMTWEALRDANTGVDYAAVGFGEGDVAVASGGHAEYVPSQRVTAGYFSVLGMMPVLGREFLLEEDVPGGPPVVVLSHATWNRYFQGDPGAIGRTITVKGEAHTIVGVAHPELRNFQSAGLWTPLRVNREGEGGGTNYLMLGRLRKGISMEQARERMRVAGKRPLAEGGENGATSLAPVPVSLKDGLIGEDRTPLLVVWCAVGLVLVIACLNVAGLLLARSETRAREVATRTALGGGTMAVVRQLLTESLLLASLGGIAGIALGYAASRALSAWVTEEAGIWQSPALDMRVLLLALGVSVFTGVLFGLVPALQTVRVNVREALTVGGSRGAAGGSSQWPRRLLVGVEVAIGLVLLIGAGLLMRTFYNLYNLPAGFDSTNVIVTSVSMNDARYDKPEQANLYYERTLAGIRAVPGVEAAAVGLHVPFDRWLNIGIRMPGRQDGGDNGVDTTLNYVTPGYFELLRIPTLAGRTIRDADNETGRRVAVVNHTFARRYFEGRNPVGEEMLLGGEKVPLVVVGMVGDVQQSPGLTRSAKFAPEPAMYIPARQFTGMMALVHTWFSPRWIIRGSRDPRALAQRIQKAFADADPLLPATEFRRIESFRDQRLSLERIQLLLLGGMAALALLLGAVGIYGLVSQNVTERTREIGIRMVMGATAASAIREVVIPIALLTLAGLIVGTGFAAWGTRFLENQIFGVRALDPATFVGAAAFLLVVSLLASLIPAQRLTRLNPAQTLRAE